MEIILCLGTTTLSQTLLDNLDGSLDRTRALHGCIIRLRHRATGGKRFELLKELPSSRADFIQPANIAHIFRFIKSRYAYKQVVLSTWDHGTGFAIFEPSGEQPASPTPAHRRRKRLSVVVSDTDVLRRNHKLFKPNELQKAHARLGARVFLKKFRSRLKDLSWLTPPKGLTMDGLNRAIKHSFGKVDILFMRNCWMQIFDTGYTLHQTVKYLVATEGLMYFRAYDYDIWLNDVAKMKGRVDLAKVAEAAIKGFTGRRTVASITTDTAMFGNDLSYYPRLNSCINALSRMLIKKMDQHKEEILKCRRRIFTLVYRDFHEAKFQLIDAGLWFERVGALFQDDHSFQDELRKFRVLYAKTVGGRSFRGKSIGFGNYGASGFSLYFPFSVEQMAEDRSFYELYYALHTRFKSQFTKASQWDEFIAALFLADPAL